MFFARNPLWILLALFFLSGCSDRQSEQEQAVAGSPGQPEPGGTVVIALGEEPDVLNGLIRRSAGAGQILDLISDNLPDMGEDLLWHPLMAKSWDIAPDRMSITYHMKPWRWSDGHVLSAHDVVSSFNLFCDPAIGSPRRGQYNDVTSAVALDSLTVRYNFSRSLPDPVARTYHSLLPAHITKELDPAQVMNWPLNQEPLSSGPFMLERWDHGRSLSLVRNPMYPGPAPFLDRIVFQIIPDPSGQAIALETGEVDFVADLSPGAAQRMREGGQIETISMQGRQYYSLDWNLRRDLFADPMTRRALSMALDRSRMIQTLMQGFGKPAVGPVAPVMWNFNQNLTAEPYEPEKARQMLTEAGWRDSDGDGVLERDGIRLSFEILTKLGDPVRENGAVILRENLASVGAEVTVRVLELASGLELLNQGKFDAYFGRFNANLYGDPSRLVHSRSVEEFNKGHYANAEVDSLLELALSIFDQEMALPHWHRLQEILLEDPPAAYLFYPEKPVGVGPRLRGVRPHLLSPLNNIARWWIPQSERKYRTGN